MQRHDLSTCVRARRIAILYVGETCALGFNGLCVDASLSSGLCLARGSFAAGILDGMSCVAHLSELVYALKFHSRTLGHGARDSESSDWS